MPEQSLSRSTLLSLMLYSEGGLLLMATIWCWATGVNLSPSLTFSLRDVAIGLSIGAITSSISLASYFMGGGVPFLSDLKEFCRELLAPLISVIGWTDIVLVSIISGFCEEVFFRGVLQNQIGLVLASLIFGFVHTPGLRYLAYPLYATVAGLILGGAYIYTGSLCAPIVAHCFHNLISLMVVRYKIWPGVQAETTGTGGKPEPENQDGNRKDD